MGDFDFSVCRPELKGVVVGEDTQRTKAVLGDYDNDGKDDCVYVERTVTQYICDEKEPGKGRAATKVPEKGKEQNIADLIRFLAPLKALFVELVRPVDIAKTLRSSFRLLVVGDADVDGDGKMDKISMWHLVKIYDENFNGKNEDKEAKVDEKMNMIEFVDNTSPAAAWEKSYRVTVGSAEAIAVGMVVVKGGKEYLVTNVNFDEAASWNAGKLSFDRTKIKFRIISMDKHKELESNLQEIARKREDTIKQAELLLDPMKDMQLLGERAREYLKEGEKNTESAYITDLKPAAAASQIREPFKAKAPAKETPKETSKEPTRETPKQGSGGDEPFPWEKEVTQVPTP